MKTAQPLNLLEATTLIGNEWCTWAFVHRATRRLAMRHETAVEMARPGAVLLPSGAGR